MKVYRPRVKVCCIQNPDEARLAIGTGADSIGLISSTPDSPLVMRPEKIREITQMIPPSIDVFVLTALDSSWDLIDLIRVVKNRTIQLVDRLNTGNYLEIRASIPCVKIVQVISAENEEAFDQAIRIDSYVDAILLKTNDKQSWDTCKEIVEHVQTPVFLSGNLDNENVREAIDTIKPFGVDVCSGVRTDGKLDGEKLRKFINETKGF